MNALVIARQGTPVAPHVELRTDWPEPTAPDAGEVQLRTLASALNHLDLWMGMGVPGVSLDYPHISGSDACAVVAAVGPGVHEAWLGRRVIVNAATITEPANHPDAPPGSTLAPAYHLLGETMHGMHRERFNAPAANIADVGDTDAEHAAAFGLTFLTAYSMMVSKAELRPGQSVLITGIGGGVALAALSIARHFGCQTVVTSRHQWKLDRALALGANHAVLDDGTGWSKQVRAFSHKRGVDLAVDSAGKATHLNCIKSLARGGAYVTPGCTSGPDATTDLARIFWNQLRILGSTMGTNAEFREVTSLLRARKLAPVLDSVYTPTEGGDAYARLESAEQFGKVVIRWGEG